MKDQLNEAYLVYIEYNGVVLKSSTSQTMRIEYFKFLNDLHIYFSDDKCKKIVEYLNGGYRLVIDFKKLSVNLVKDKEISFDKYFMQSMTPQAAEEWYQEEINKENANGFIW